MAIQPTTQNTKRKNSFNLFLKNYFNFILVIALIVFLLIAYFFILAPKYQTTLAAIKDNIIEQQRLYNAQKKKLANYKDIAALYKKVNASDLKKFNNVLSDEYVKESLFGEIEDIVVQNGFLINQISIKIPEEKDKESAAPNSEKAAILVPPANFGEINISLSLGAIDYAGFKSLVKIFETNLRLLDMSQVSFSADSGTANLTLRTYYYKKNEK